MPSRNTIKDYVDNCYYHIYNRGVEKRLVFVDKQDYTVFLSYLREYLLPKDSENLYKRLADPSISWKEKDRILKALRLNNFFQEITLLAYCLMPNHFHFLIRQKSANSIDQFMQSVFTRYTMYFNRKYKRVGSLFQAVYKAVSVTSDEQLLHLTRYIHKQALASQGETLRDQPCSYEDYLEKKKTDWVHPEEILAFFSKNQHSLSYETFVSEQVDPDILKRAMLEV